MVERTDRRDNTESSETCVLRDRADNFLVGPRLAPNESDVASLRVKTFLFLRDENRTGEEPGGVAVLGGELESGRWGTMKP